MRARFDDVRFADVIRIGVAVVLGGIGAAAGFTHTHDWAANHGQTGWLAWATAVVIEGIAIVAGIEIHHDRAAGRSFRFPMIVLCFGVLVQMTAQVAEAEPSPAGWLVAAMPALGFLAVVKLLMRRMPTRRPNRRRPSPRRHRSRLRWSYRSPTRTRCQGSNCPPTSPPGSTPRSPPHGPKAGNRPSRTFNGWRRSPRTSRDECSPTGGPPTAIRYPTNPHAVEKGGTRPSALCPALSLRANNYRKEVTPHVDTRRQDHRPTQSPRLPRLARAGRGHRRMCEADPAHGRLDPHAHPDRAGGRRTQWYRVGTVRQPPVYGLPDLLGPLRRRRLPPHPRRPLGWLQGHP